MKFKYIKRNDQQMDVPQNVGKKNSFPGTFSQELTEFTKRIKRKKKENAKETKCQSTKGLPK